MFGKEYIDRKEAQLTTPDTWAFRDMRIHLFGSVYKFEDLSDFALEDFIRRAQNEITLRSLKEPSCAKPSPIEESQLPLTSTTEKNDTMSLTRHFPTEG